MSRTVAGTSTCSTSVVDDVRGVRPPGGRTISGTCTACWYITHFDIIPWLPPISPWSLV